MKKAVVLSVLVLCCLCFVSEAQTAYGEVAPLVRAVDRIPSSYILKIRDGGVSAFSQSAEGLGVEVRDVLPISSALIVHMPETALERVRKNPLIEWVEEDGYVRLSAQKSASNTSAAVADLWGLDVVDRNSGCRTDQKFGYQNGGGNTTIYVIDTGVYPSHSEFMNTGSSRVRGTSSTLKPIINQLVATYPSPYNNSLHLGLDCWTAGSTGRAAGHGTAVASVAAGSLYGVANEAKIVDARAFNCSGSSTIGMVNKALEWIPNDSGYTSGPRVVNMSFEFSIYEDNPGQNVMRTLIDTLVNQHNITVVAAAGNSSGDVWWSVPGSALSAITVGGIKKTPGISGEEKWQYSNWGGRVDIYAPAQYIQSAHHAFPWVRSSVSGCANDPDTCTSGTSFAAPFVSGMAAIYLHQYQTATPAQVQSYLETSSTYTITDPSGNVRKVLNVNGNLSCP